MARRPRTRVMKPRGSPPMMPPEGSMMPPEGSMMPPIPVGSPMGGGGPSGPRPPKPMMPDPVQTAVQQMPYSYKGITAQDIMDYSGEVRQLTPEQMAVADVNQDVQLIY